MYCSQYNLEQTIEVRFTDNPSNALVWLLGGQIEGFSAELMMSFLINVGRFISQIFCGAIGNKKGLANIFLLSLPSLRRVHEPGLTECQCPVS